MEISDVSFQWNFHVQIFPTIISVLPYQYIFVMFTCFVNTIKIDLIGLVFCHVIAFNHDQSACNLPNPRFVPKDGST
jgi:hypothetical protein